MTTRISDARRAKIVAALESGASYREAAKAVGVSPTTVGKVAALERVAKPSKGSETKPFHEADRERELEPYTDTVDVRGDWTRRHEDEPEPGVSLGPIGDEADLPLDDRTESKADPREVPDIFRHAENDRETSRIVAMLEESGTDTDPRYIRRGSMVCEGAERLPRRPREFPIVIVGGR